MKSRLLSLSVSVALGAFLALAAGCGDDDGSPAQDASADASQIVEPDASVGDSLTFHVATTIWGNTDYQPAEGATVAFDTPGGDRIESITGADGRVTFDGIDWSLGKASVTAFKFGFTLRSGVNIDASWIEAVEKVGGEPLLLLYNLENPPEPTFSAIVGAATGMDDTAHEYVVNTLFGLTGTESTRTGDAAYSIHVPYDEPFIIQARERDYTALPSGQGYEQTIYRVLQMDHPAITAGANGVVLDFLADEVTTYTAETWFALPSRADSPLHDGQVEARVGSTRSRYCHGWPTYLDINPGGGQFDVSFLWTEPPEAQNVYTSISVWNGNEYSYKSVAGYPQPGFQGTLYDVPRWAAPVDPVAGQSLWERLEWEVFDEDLPSTQLRLQRNQKVVWMVLLGPNATSATVPAPPSIVDTSAFLGTSPLQGRLRLGVLDIPTANWTSFAISKDAQLQP